MTPPIYKIPDCDKLYYSDKNYIIVTIFYSDKNLLYGDNTTYKWLNDLTVTKKWHKLLDSNKIYLTMTKLLDGDKNCLTMTKLIASDKNYLVVTKITWQWQKKLDCDKNYFKILL